MKERENHLANLKAIRSNVDKAIKQVEKELEEGRPTLWPGQIWQHSTHGPYLTTRIVRTGGILLVNLATGISTEVMGANLENFTYIGESNALVRVESK